MQKQPHKTDVKKAAGLCYHKSYLVCNPSVIEVDMITMFAVSACKCVACKWVLSMWSCNQIGAQPIMLGTILLHTIPCQEHDH